MIGYKTGADMSADLKRQAHAVRQAIDARPIARDAEGRPVNPRKRRLVQVTAENGVSRQLPDLEPQARHGLSIGRPLRFERDASNQAHWYVRGMRDRNDNGQSRRKAA